LPSNPLETYNYDSVGNRAADSNQNGLSQFNSANDLNEDGDFTYQYDNNGNLTRKTAKVGGAITSYEYDAENKLARVVRNGTTVNYKYDGLGRRVEKEVINVGTAVTRYVYDNEDIILEFNHKGKMTARYTHGLGTDEPLAVEKRREIYYYHVDGLGSVTALTDRRQRVVESYDYDSFGNLKRHGHKVKQPYTFTGREWDKEIGLYYYRARYYDASGGRFISFDPILHPGNGRPIKAVCNQSITYPDFEALKDSPQTLNPFVYAKNNPTLLTDPSGLAACEGRWRTVDFQTVVRTNFCVCFWLCVPCDAPVIWGGNPFTLPATGGVATGSLGTCVCPKPGPETGCPCDKKQ